LIFQAAWPRLIPRCGQSWALPPYAVGMVARFGAHKDYPCYFAAAEQILARRDDITFLAIGDGPGLEAWQARFAQQPRVRVLGRRGDVERICAVLDAGVLATAVGAHGEGISNALTEFLAVGKPVVATDDGGNRELVGEHGCGLLVPPADPAALAAAIERLIDRPDEARAMGEKGAAWCARCSAARPWWMPGWRFTGRFCAKSAKRGGISAPMRTCFPASERAFAALPKGERGVAAGGARQGHGAENAIISYENRNRFLSPQPAFGGDVHVGVDKCARSCQDSAGGRRWVACRSIVPCCPPWRPVPPGSPGRGHCCALQHPFSGRLCPAGSGRPARPLPAGKQAARGSGMAVGDRLMSAGAGSSRPLVMFLGLRGVGGIQGGVETHVAELARHLPFPLERMEVLGRSPYRRADTPADPSLPLPAGCPRRASPRWRRCSTRCWGCCMRRCGGRRCCISMASGRAWLRRWRACWGCAWWPPTTARITSARNGAAGAPHVALGRKAGGAAIERGGVHFAGVQRGTAQQLSPRCGYVPNGWTCCARCRPAPRWRGTGWRRGAMW
jgi:hypothetical protein